MTESVKTNNVILRSTYFAFLINPNGPKKYRYIVIVSNMLEFLSKGIFSTNHIRSTRHFYNYKPHKIGGKNRLVTTDDR